MSNVNKQLIAIDPGKYATKGITLNNQNIERRVTFRTKMDPTEETKSIMSETYVVNYNGESHLVGKGAETEDYDVSKTKLIHKIATYVAISKLINKEDFDGTPIIDLIIGCPLSIFSKVDARDEYIKYIKGEGLISLVIDGKEHEFLIDKIYAAPESSGILMKKQKEYKDKLVGVIDIGGLNTNCCVYHTLTPIASTMFTNNLGANVLRTKLRDHLNNNLENTNLQNYQMEYIIKQGYVKSSPEKSKQLINDFFYEHLNSILNEAKKNAWDINNMEMLFVGGGSLLLESQIKSFVTDAEVSETAQWDNVEGFYIMGKLLIG